MKYLDHFSVPYMGLKNGSHIFNFEVDDQFFNYFENETISSGHVNVQLTLDKRADMSEAFFDFVGDVQLNCDRCLAPLTYDLDHESKLLIKYGEEDLDEDEVMFIHPEVSIINFAHIIYEFILLSLPMIVSHEDINECDQDIISKINIKGDPTDTNPTGDALKNLKLN